MRPAIAGQGRNRIDSNESSAIKAGYLRLSSTDPGHSACELRF